ncbi:MAG TPA: phosphoribosylanthranilate isomerase [Phycisphaeraceae bacterium]
MPRTRIKICGIRDAATAFVAAEAGADAVGLVFVPGSPRQITLEEARHIVAALPPWVEPVGLFRDEPADRILQAANALRLRTVQLHGNEPPELAAELAPLRVIKALPFDGPEPIRAAIDRWRSCANLAGLLLDAPPTPGEKLTGGSGRQLDWNQLAQLIQLLQRGSAPSAEAAVRSPAPLPPIVLAGGLRPDNVIQAIATVRPYGVDVSSGVESARGVKDRRLIQAFCCAVRRIDAQLDLDRAASAGAGTSG